MDEDLRREIEGHLDEATNEYIRRGLCPETAAKLARRDFGGVLRATEAHREARRGFIGRQAEATAQDLRQSLRSFRTQPFFTLCVVLVLALGIGLVTSVLSLLNAQFFRLWQVSSPDSMAVIRARPAPGEPYGTIAIPEYQYLRDHSRTIAKMLIWYGSETTIELEGKDIRIVSAVVNADYFRALGVPMSAGRSFGSDEEDLTMNLICSYWLRRLGWRS